MATVIIVSILLTGSSLTFLSPIRTVKGLLIDAGFSPSGGLSIDSGRVAFEDSTQKTFYVYDINSNTSTSFPGPNGAGFSYRPAIYGDKLVAPGNITSLLQPFTGTISYCVLPHTVPLQPCGPWHLLAKGVGGASNFVAYGFPVIHGDLTAWWVFNGIQYHRFSSNVTETDLFPSPNQPVGLSTNGEIVAFTLATHPANPDYCGPVEYIDTTNEAQGVVNTGLYNCSSGSIPSTSVSQYTIAFADNSSGQDRIRYYDYTRNQASLAGAGPRGDFSWIDNPVVWGDRITFTSSETALNFDCDGDGQIQSSQSCLQYWNIRAPSYAAATLAARAAPPLGATAVAIYDKTIVFVGTNGHLQYVIVPMQGDVDLDGVVDVTDKNLLLNCLGQILKGNVC